MSNLFDAIEGSVQPKTLARTDDPDTSKDAAKSLKVSGKRLRLLKAFVVGGPMTADQES